jgi:hypothetical protein
LAPEAVAAFYAARGFPEAVAAEIAAACVLQTRLVNGSEADVTVDLDQWRIRTGSDAWRPLPSRRAWVERFVAAGVPARARIAFEWSQFPWRAELTPGEALRGMILYGLEPGTSFDVTARIRVGDRPIEARFERVRCPAPRAGGDSEGGANR